MIINKTNMEQPEKARTVDIKASSGCGLFENCDGCKNCVETIPHPEPSESFEEGLWEEWQKSGAHNFLEDSYDWWTDKIKSLLLSERTALVERLIAEIDKEMPTAWFPNGALHLKRKYFEQVVSILTKTK